MPRAFSPDGPVAYWETDDMDILSVVVYRLPSEPAEVQGQLCWVKDDVGSIISPAAPGMRSIWQLNGPSRATL